MDSKTRTMKRRSALKWADLQPYLLVLPALLFIAAIVVYPLVSNVINSLQTDYRAINQGAKEWVGFANYRAAWHDGLLQVSVRNSFLFTASCVGLCFVMGFAAALLLNRLARGQTAYRVLIVLPWVISPVVAGFAWRWLLNDHFGYVNYLLLKLGLIRQNIVWLGDPLFAFVAIILAGTWRMFPFVMIMMLAGLQSVSIELLEAADIDGAGPWQKFVSVTVPQVRGVIVVVLLLTFIWMFNEFSIVKIMTKGGPLQSTMVLPVLIEKLTFINLRMGTASALALMLAAVLLVFSVLYLRFIEKETD
jgi:multiple sugar transport system permease protein